jgi:hypothetical protein
MISVCVCFLIFVFNLFILSKQFPSTCRGLSGFDWLKLDRSNFGSFWNYRLLSDGDLR